MHPRKATLKLLSGGVDISGDIAPHVLQFTFSDKAHGETDDIAVTFHDRDHLWKAGWMPDKGDVLVASIECTDWYGPGNAVTLQCGTFTVDETECSGSGQGDTASIKAVSAAIDAPLRMEKKTRAYENTSLQQVAEDVAGRNGLELFYQGEDIRFTRLDQRQESDLKFLQRVAEKQGINIKVADGKITMFSGLAGDAQAPVKTFTRGSAEISRFQLRTKSAEVYKGCTVEYWDSEKKQNIVQEFVPGDAPETGHVLKVNLRCESQSEAERVAQNELRQANKQEYEGTLDLMGQPDIYAGQVIALSGFYRFDGTWYVESATHRLSRGQGYTTSLSIRQTLDY